jgi:hypothetical protein
MIKKITITIQPKSKGTDWTEFSDFVLSSYDNDEYEYSPEESTDLSHVFYGRDEANVIEFIKEQLTEDNGFSADLAAKADRLTEGEWDQMREQYDFEAEWEEDSSE